MPLPGRLHSVLSLAAAALLYGWLWPLVTPDMTQSYGPWLEHVETIGPLAAIGHPFGDYTPPFIYLLALASLGQGLLSTASLVKLISVSGTAVLALAARRLLRVLDVDHAGAWAACVPLLPGIAFNAALMASGDAWWASGCLLAVAAAAERRHGTMLAWYGAALAFKQQAICLAPFILGLLLARRVPLRWWVIAPLGYLASFAPAFLAGAPLSSMVSIYARQAGFYDTLSLNAPNLWAIVQQLPGTGAIPLTGLALAAAVGASAWLVARITTLDLGKTALVAAALASPLLVVGLLPRMHERYFYLADVLALIWSAAAARRGARHEAMLVQAGSLLGILAYMSGVSGLASLGAVAMMLATARVLAALRPAVKANDNGFGPLPLGVTM